MRHRQKLVDLTIGGKNYKIATNTFYTITRTNGNHDKYYVVGVVNRTIGNTALRMRHSDGFYCYAPLTEIVTMKPV
jgi:hypothetical protein